MGRIVKIKIELFPLVNSPAPGPDAEESPGVSGIFAACFLPIYKVLRNILKPIFPIIDVMMLPFSRIYGILFNRAGEEDDPGKDEEGPRLPGENPGNSGLKKGVYCG